MICCSENLAWCRWGKWKADRLARSVALLIPLVDVAGCEARRPDFLVRVREDCTAGDRWACDLLDALSHRKPVESIKPTDSIRNGIDAIQKG